MMKLTRLPLFFALFFLVTNEAGCQISFLGGPNVNTVRNHNILENQKILIGYQLGAGIRYYPFKKLKKVSFENQLVYNLKGYKQDIDNHIYTTLFYYISFPVLVNYHIHPAISLNAGIQPSYLFGTNIEKGTDTFNSFDLGVIAGITVFDNKIFSIYTRLDYSVLYLLNYYNIDKVGNFNGVIKDLYNTSVNLGVKIHVSREKIKFYTD